ncbi:MAG: hypothetical protein EU529_01675 [Promethearchaeota archaeon]|nr:MAG: hypothetical protein EU529_01675 [Candidatus Lokiarchaeota archaeon]
MNVIKKNEDYVILKLHWFEKYYGYILMFLSVFLPEVIFFLILGFFLKKNLFYIFLMGSLILLQLFLIFSYKYFIEINFEKEQVFTYVKILGIKIDLINCSIYDISSLVSVLEISRQGIICKISMQTKAGILSYVKKPLLKLASLSRRSRKFYEYYIDFYNILIVKVLKEKGYNIRSNLINLQSLLIDVNFDNLKKLSKEHSSSKQFPLDVLVCFHIFFSITIWIFFIILIIIKYLSILFL